MTSEHDERPESAAASSEDPLQGLGDTRAMPSSRPQQPPDPPDLDATRIYRPGDYQTLEPAPGAVNGHSYPAAQPRDPTAVEQEPDGSLRAAQAEQTSAAGFTAFPPNGGETRPPTAEDGGPPGDAVGPVAAGSLEEPLGPQLNGAEAAAAGTVTVVHPQRRAGPIVREIVETIILAAVIFLGVRAIVQNFRVEGSSMFASFYDGEYMLVNKAVYTRIDLGLVHKVLPFVSAGSNPEHYIFHGPQRGDVIVFVPPPQANQPGKDFIKRVIGLPGDTIDFRDNHVFVDGRQVIEPYITAQTQCQGGAYCHVQLQKNQFFVMGDNRTNSSDSRFWGPVSGDKIIGKALLTYFCDGSQCKGHFDHVGLSPNHSTQLAPAAKPGS